MSVWQNTPIAAMRKQRADYDGEDGIGAPHQKYRHSTSGGGRGGEMPKDVYRPRTPDAEVGSGDIGGDSNQQIIERQGDKPLRGGETDPAETKRKTHLQAETEVSQQR